jgi:hypothetical protein
MSGHIRADQGRPGQTRADQGTPGQFTALLHVMSPLCVPACRAHVTTTLRLHAFLHSFISFITITPSLAWVSLLRYLLYQVYSLWLFKSIPSRCSSLPPHAIAISIFLPFMLVHCINAAPTIDTVAVATDT